MKYLQHVLIFILFSVAIIYAYKCLNKINYNIQYKDMVIETIQKTVKKEALK